MQQPPNSLSDNFTVGFISAADTIDLRMRILRPLHPREFCEYPEDNLPTTFHVGVKSEGKVVSNGTFMQQGHAHFPKAVLPYRLRGMATDPSYQGQGLGRKIILAAEDELKKRGCDLLWFNARVSAEVFYKKLGYTAIEEVFNIDTIGAHKVMFKSFSNV
ncbi:MAG: acetyltransferase [Pseudobdellovibrio sp.]|jgi:GNAT superfamily N-acetyltransferase|nr:acetyltransferase [Pseudobdellovibrio sp.]